ncbi:EAL domain-containing protein [Burkholderia gladioli]|nr:EAL domain-containing protein [Burkholderia gladioli]MBU9421468.1 EAL domain-containing protein [Burkholderia gladioli]QPQ87044.1 EAL domain-containing protein [Burkholderia gladioli]
MKIIRKRPASSLAPRPGRRHRCTRRDRAVTGAKLLHHPPGAVLVVDDDPAQRALLGNMLGRLGHRCVAVAGPVQASACLRDTAVVAVLLALRPAGDSWLGMARCLADRPALPLIVTGTCDERTRRAAMRLARACGVSVAGALGQPVRAAELAALLAASTGNDALQAPDARAEPAEEDFASALATGRIRPAFQPKVGLADGRVVGVEALARWYSPREDPVGPERFVPLAAGWGRLAELTDVSCQPRLRPARAGGAISPRSAWRSTSIPAWSNRDSSIRYGNGSCNTAFRQDRWCSRSRSAAPCPIRSSPGRP